MSILVQVAIAIALLVAGFGGGVKYHAGVIAQRDLAAERLVASDRVQQRKFGDVASGQHAGALSKLSNQLGAAREKIVKLSGRECLSADIVGVLNAIGSEPGRAPAGEPAGAPQAAAGGGGLRFSTDRDAATAIATCRAYYAEVSGQVNKILDIEDRRHPQ